MKKISLLLLPFTMFSLLTNCNKADNRKWYEHEDWWKYCSNGVENVQAIEEDIGKEVNLTVNNQIHKVRLIDIDHDTLSSGMGKAHCTFEFVNLLCDDMGCSLATVWNWKDGGSSKNYDFLNSNLRKALDGNGEGELWWYRRGRVESEQTKGTDYKNKCVLDMLPSDLQDNLKEVKKPIELSKDGKTYAIDEESYVTKVFSLSYREITEDSGQFWQPDEGTTYKYYLGDKDKAKSKRVHIQILKEHYASAPTIEDGYYNEAKNHAGYYTEATEIIVGNYYWLRSPHLNSTDKAGAWKITTDGVLINEFIYKQAVAVVPAFCI
ncbi:MAG: DUF6273 domain-containing protein [Bacilli bacterium]|nr:DUF6273 domain-containing protein [Bacilli bacterium]